MPPKKSIAFGKIGTFGASMKNLTIEATEKDGGNDEGGFGKFGKTTTEDDSSFIPEPTCDRRPLVVACALHRRREPVQHST